MSTDPMINFAGTDVHSEAIHKKQIIHKTETNFLNKVTDAQSAQVLETRSHRQLIRQFSFCTLLVGTVFPFFSDSQPRSSSQCCNTHRIIPSVYKAPILPKI